MNLPRTRHLRYWKPLPYLLALLCTLGILALHMLPNMDSMLNENDTRISHGFLKSQIDYHQEIAPFARRPLTSFLIESVVGPFGLRYGHAFILINFSLLFLSGCLLYRLSRILKATTGQALLNCCLYYGSFSILFAFFPPVFSYDEPLQYSFLLLSLMAYVRRKWGWFVLTFTLALISRETSLLLLPALLCFAPDLMEKKDILHHQKLSKKYFFILLPVLCYAVYLLIFMQVFDQLEATRIEMASRYTCFLENFESLKNTVESFTSFYLALGPFLYLTLFSIGKKNLPVFNRKWIHAFLLSVLINSPIVMVSAFARETRLFALPLFFVWPVFAQLFAADLKKLFSVEVYRFIFLKRKNILLFIVLNVSNYLFCFVFYQNLDLGANTYFMEYLFVINLILILHYLLYASATDKAIRFS